jgi:cell division protein FtsB
VLRTVLVVLAVLLVLLQIQVWRQYARVDELESRLQTQREQNGELAARNDALAAEVTDLKSGLAAVEERARAELGLIREGEAFYLVVEPEDLDPEDAEALRRQRAAAQEQTEPAPAERAPPEDDG